VPAPGSPNQRYNKYIFCQYSKSSTYDHSTLKAENPVRSSVLTQRSGELVVRSVTTGESSLLYVFFPCSDESLFARTTRKS
jgi:hypothetical protein